MSKTPVILLLFAKLIYCHDQAMAKERAALGRKRDGYVLIISVFGRQAEEEEKEDISRR
jgi:hypothetical protein